MTMLTVEAQIVQESWPRGDLLPVLSGIVKDSKGQPVALTAPVFFVAWKADDDTAVFIDYSAVTIDPDQILNKGKFTFAWTALMADVVGRLKCRLRLGNAGTQHTRMFWIARTEIKDSDQVTY